MDYLIKTRHDGLTLAQRRILQNVFNGGRFVNRPSQIKMVEDLAKRGLLTLSKANSGYKLALIYSAFEKVNEYRYGTDWQVRKIT